MSYATLAEAKAAGAATINYGVFVNTLIGFMIVALAIFLIALNLYAESHSLSAVIRARPLLRRLDRWGNGRVSGEW